MSVMFSHIDFNPQDDDEEQLDIEDAHQQEELKAFLDNELDDDYLLEDASFTSHVFNNRNSDENEKNSSPPTMLNMDFPTETNIKDNGFSFGLSEDYLQLRKSVYPFQQQPFISELNNNAESYVDINSNSAEYLPKNNREQLEILYQARGRKIEELQKCLEEKVEEKEKEIRVLRHKLTMSSTEMEGLRISIGQLNAVIQDQKHEINNLQDLVQNEQEQCRLLTNQIEEANEKLFVSDSTISALQMQIRELNQTESLSRARAHHESMLASMREKHEEEILSLKEKVDDLQQSLAWKSEDLNRYKELLDSNSSGSEIGMLRNRLSNEEKKVLSLEKDMALVTKHNNDLEEQLKMFEVALKADTTFGYLSSTPLNAATAHMGRDQVDYKSPIARDAKRLNTKANDDSNVRNELIKALNSNREKRQEIKMLYDEIASLKLHFEKKSNTSKEHEFACKAINRSLEMLADPKPCEACKSLQNDLDTKSKEFQAIAIEFNKKLESLEKENLELKKNMVEMVKNFDKDKMNCLEKQNNALMQLVNDAKENLKKELLDAHQQKISSLNKEIDRLNGELLFTQEEYNKLCDDVKSVENHLAEEFNRENQLALLELENKLQNEHQENLLQLKDKLNSQHIEDIEASKVKWMKEHAMEQDILIQNAVSSSKIDFMNDYKNQLAIEINKAVNVAKNEWLTNQNLETDALIKQLKDEWTSEQQGVIQAKLNSAKIEWDLSKKNEFSTMVKDHQTEVKILQESLAFAQKEIIFLKSRLLSTEKTFESFQVDFNKQNIKNVQKLNSESVKNNEVNSNVADFKSAVDKSQSSVLLDEILRSNDHNSLIQNQLDVWKEKESSWIKREEKLTLLIQEMQEQGAIKNSSTQNILGKSHQNVLEQRDQVLPALEEKLNTIIRSKEKVWNIKEINYKKEINSIAEELKNMKNVIIDKDQQIFSLRKDFLDLKESGDAKIYQYQKQLSDFKSVIKKLEEQLMLEKEISKEEFDSLQSTIEGKIQTAVLAEKKKLQQELDKFRDEQLKTESMLLKERLLNEVHNQSEREIKEVEAIKAEYDVMIKNLKQGFRQKLEKISEMKKKWLAEEEEKRGILEQNFKEQLSTNKKILQEKHNDLFLQQRLKYENILAELEESLAKEKEEKNKEIRTFQIEKSKMEEVIASMTSLHKQEISALDAEWQSRLDKEHFIIEHYKTMRQRDGVKEQEYVKHINELKMDDRFKETNDKQVLDNTPNEGVENMRAFYLRAVEQINFDVMEHIKSMRTNAATQIREAVKKERRDIFRKLKSKKEAKSLTNNSDQLNDKLRNNQTSDPFTNRHFSDDKKSQGRNGAGTSYVQSNNDKQSYSRRFIENDNIQNIRPMNSENDNQNINSVFYSQQTLSSNPEKLNKLENSSSQYLFNNDYLKPQAKNSHFSVASSSVNDIPVNLKRNDGKIP